VQEEVNAQAEALFGLARERMLGNLIEMLVFDRLRDRHAAQRASYMKCPKPRHMPTDLLLLGNAPAARSSRLTSC
jgi:hypothetical protein